MARLHPRLSELIEELSPELQGRGFAPKPGCALWTRRLPSGQETIALGFSPDDEQGGWMEPFVGLISDPVESILAELLEAPVTYGLRHTVLLGSTRFQPIGLPRQPVHERSDVLEAANVTLRWIAKARPVLAEAFLTSATDRQAGLREDIELSALDELFNTPHPLAHRYLTHELHRAMRGITISNLRRPRDLMAVLDFHRNRLQDNGFWDVYGERILEYAAAFQD